MKFPLEKLIAIVGEEGLVRASVASETRPASLWLSNENLSCAALVRPKTTAELAAVMKLCFEHGQTVVPHGGLTSVSRGEKSTPDDLVISLERMNDIEEIDVLNKTVTVQAGVILQQLQQAVAAHDLLFPLDLGAKGSCMIGGNISTNAGGLQALRYGVMRNLVLGLEVVLADGTVISSLNKMMKNNAGYDLKQLFIGSEGTLGIVTKAILKVENLPRSRNTAYVALDSFGKSIQLLQNAKRVLQHQLTSYEIIWNDYYRLMTSPPSEFRPPLPQEYPYYVLLEALGQDAEADKSQFEAFLEQNLEGEIIVDAAIAHSKQELDWFWGIREKVEFVFQMHQPVFLFDVSLPVSEMEAYINTLKQNLAEKWVESYCYTFGHKGDGNLHLFISCGENTLETRHAVEEMVFQPLQKMGGSITAEHGVGLEKKTWLHYSRSEAEIALMRTVKKALDPKNILNRGKIFD